MKCFQVRQTCMVKLLRKKVSHMRKGFLMKNEEMIIYDITNNICNPDYLFDLSEYKAVDWKVLFEIACKQRIFPIIFQKIKNYLPQDQRTTYMTYWMSHQYRVKCHINEAIRVTNILNDNAFRFVMVKGFLLSHLLYKNVFLRQIGDIDFILHKDDMILACRKMEENGYVDELVDCITNSDFSIPDSEIDLHYLSGKEKAFIGESGILVEIKKDKYKFSDIEASTAMSHRIDIDINDSKFYCFDIKDMFIHIVENMCYNFFTVPGVIADYIIRDIVDFYKLIIEYKDIFTLDYLSLIEKRNHMNHLVLSMDILKDYFDDEALSKIPNSLLTLKSDPEELNEFTSGWKSTFLSRLFNRNHRITEMRLRELQRAVKQSKSFKTKSVNVTKHPYDVRKGLVETPFTIWMSPIIDSITEEKVRFGFGYGNDRTHLSLEIPINYPDIFIGYSLIYVSSKQGELCKHDTDFEFVNKNVSKLYSSKNCVENFVNEVNKKHILTISIPHDEAERDIRDYYIRFDVMFRGTNEYIGRLGGYQEVYKFSVNNI